EPPFLPARETRDGSQGGQHALLAARHPAAALATAGCGGIDRHLASSPCLGWERRCRTFRGGSGTSRRIPYARLAFDRSRNEAACEFVSTGVASIHFEQQVNRTMCSFVVRTKCARARVPTSSVGRHSLTPCRAHRE